MQGYRDSVSCTGRLNRPVCRRAGIGFIGGCSGVMPAGLSGVGLCRSGNRDEMMNDEDDTFFIADLGECPTVCIHGKPERIPRYAVWNRPAARIVDTGDDLPALLEKYRLSMVHVMKYKPFFSG